MWGGGLEDLPFFPLVYFVLRGTISPHPDQTLLDFLEHLEKKQIVLVISLVDFLLFPPDVIIDEGFLANEQLSVGVEEVIELGVVREDSGFDLLLVGRIEDGVGGDGGGEVEGEEVAVDDGADGLDFGEGLLVLEEEQGEIEGGVGGGGGGERGGWGGLVG